ncbi:MAG: uracil-DNA glycosylase, partial [Deltaproteobacteria bacterium]
MDESLTREARALVRSARALLHELAEEGVDEFERVLPAPGARADAAEEPTLPGMEPAPVKRPGPPPLTSVPARSVTLEQVREELGDCTRCRLHAERNQIVFGDGNPNAELMFIGEGPGEQEDLRGIPFCGRAGDLLTRMIERGLGIPRSEVYICNIVKCRPPGNRTPLADEVASCRPFLDGQIEAVRPAVLIALGKPAA